MKLKDLHKITCTNRPLFAIHHVLFIANKGKDMVLEKDRGHWITVCEWWNKYDKKHVWDKKGKINET